jgi:hypothetical protein
MLKKVISDESGRALVLALIALGVGMMLLPTFLAQVNTNLFASRAIEVGIKEYYSSDAAIEYTLWRIKCDPTFREDLIVGEPISYTVPVGNAAVSVSLAQLSSAGGSNEVDAVLVMDKSGSMKDDGWDYEIGDYQPIGNAKIAAKAFVDILEDYSDASASHKVGLVSYSSSATLEEALTTVYADVRDAIDSMSADGYTGVGDAIAVASQELQPPPVGHGRENSVKAIILLSDGKANVCPDGYRYCCSDPPPPSRDCYNTNDCAGPCATYAEDVADGVCEATEGGINFFTIALGTDTDTDLMKYIARFDQSRPDGCEPGNGVDPGETPDFYQESPSSEDLEDKFRRIALYLTSPQYNIIATTGDTTIESRVQHSEEYDLVGIFTWFTR